MKASLILIFLFILNCSTPFNKSEKVYICGDHPCKNSKEAEEYFNNNISIEVYTITSDKNKNENFSLVELNMLEDKLKTKEKITISDKKINIKKAVNERKKLAKLKIKRVEEIEKKTPKIVQKKVISKNKKPKQFTFIRICKNLEECDIDKIAKIMMDIGKQKNFPDISN